MEPVRARIISQKLFMFSHICIDVVRTTRNVLPLSDGPTARQNSFVNDDAWICAFVFSAIASTPRNLVSETSTDAREGDTTRIQIHRHIQNPDGNRVHKRRSTRLQTRGQPSSEPCIYSVSNTKARTSIDSLCGASAGLLASANALCGVRRALSVSES